MGPIIEPYSALSDMAGRFGQQMVADREAQRQRQQTLAQAISPVIADAMRLGAAGYPGMLAGLQQQLEGTELSGLAGKLQPRLDDQQKNLFQAIAQATTPFDENLMQLSQSGIAQAQLKQNFLLERMQAEQKARQEQVSTRRASMDEARASLAQVAPRIEEIMRLLPTAEVGALAIPSLGGTLGEFASEKLGQSIEESLSDADLNALRNNLALVGAQLQKLPGTTPSNQELNVIGKKLTTRMSRKALAQAVTDLYRVFETESIAASVLTMMEQEGRIIDNNAIIEAYEIAAEEQQRGQEAEAE